MPEETTEPVEDPKSDEKAAVFSQMQASADGFTQRGMQTRNAFFRGQHRKHVSSLAEQARKRYDEISGEPTGEDDDNGNSSNGGSGTDHTARSESNTGGSERG